MREEEIDSVIIILFGLIFLVLLMMFRLEFITTSPNFYQAYIVLTGLSFITFATFIILMIGKKYTKDVQDEKEVKE